MGPSGQGGFGGSSGDTFGQSGSSGTFASSSSQPHQNDPFSRGFYYDPFYNNQRPYTERRGDAASGRATPASCGLCLGMFASIASLFGSIWILIGIYKSEQMPLGLNYSRVVKAHSAFVSEIQEWGFWLNKGSSIKLSHDIKGTAQDTLVLAFIEGKAAFDEWLDNPLDSSKALRWYRINGNGSKDFEVKTDDEYYVAFGNLNRKDIQFSMELEFHFSLHSRKGALTTSMFTTERESMSFPLSLIGSTFVLLTTPNASQVGVDVWEVEVVYVTRWATFIIIWGLVALVIAVIIGLQKGWLNIVPRSGEQVPLMSPDVEQSTPSHAASYPTSFLPASVPPGEYDEHQQRGSGDHLCTVCLDAPKDCFFDPCGHRCTCYVCGQRIQSGDTPICPICRQPIRTVRKIFDS